MKQVEPADPPHRFHLRLVIGRRSRAECGSVSLDGSGFALGDLTTLGHVVRVFGVVELTLGGIKRPRLLELEVRDLLLKRPDNLSVLVQVGGPMIQTAWCLFPLRADDENTSEQGDTTKGFGEISRNLKRVLEMDFHILQAVQHGQDHVLRYRAALLRILDEPAVVKLHACGEA